MWAQWFNNTQMIIGHLSIYCETLLRTYSEIVNIDGGWKRRCVLKHLSTACTCFSWRTHYFYLEPERYKSWWLMPHLIVQRREWIVFEPPVGLGIVSVTGAVLHIVNQPWRDQDTSNLCWVSFTKEKGCHFGHSL